ncbi:MAG: Flp pilus assembly complex ATPase component TadA [Clostridia bacterium]|nr:Flp pilus assembly complex ATPase component TadA [Clostridia bacterium]
MKKLEAYLPLDILSHIRHYGNINELRIKRNSALVIKKDNRFIITDCKTDDSVFDEILDRLLEHSYHSKLGQIVEGYISLGDGYRAGIAGQAVVQNGAVTNISEISSVNIRIPYLIKGVSEGVVLHLRSTDFRESVLVYSPPGVGKTTLLRDLIIRLCREPYNKRVSVIDSRCEIYHSSMACLDMLDLYLGYPKQKGIEQAIRSMAPDIIICDEIGNDAETDAILANQSAGIPIVATAHGSSCKALLRRSNINRMDRAGVFGCYIGISRKSAGSGYNYEFNKRNDIE